MAKTRKSIGAKLRFEVFKRDKFTCRYCGGKAPDVLLALDHMEPVSKGGGNDILNLITSCKDCNSGKGATRLSDHAVLDQQRAQLEELQERENQLRLMMQWQRSLSSAKTETLREVSVFWSELWTGYNLNEAGERELGQLLAKFSVEEVCTAMRTSVDVYQRHDSNGKITQESINKAFAKLGGICFMQKQPQSTKDAFLIRGIVIKKCPRLAWKVMGMPTIRFIEQCLQVAPADLLRSWANDCKHPDDFLGALQSLHQNATKIS